MCKKSSFRILVIFNTEDYYLLKIVNYCWLTSNVTIEIIFEKDAK